MIFFLLLLESYRLELDFGDLNTLFTNKNKIYEIGFAKNNNYSRKNNERIIDIVIHMFRVPYNVL